MKYYPQNNQFGIEFFERPWLQVDPSQLKYSMEGNSLYFTIYENDQMNGDQPTHQRFLAQGSWLSKKFVKSLVNKH